MASTKKAIGVIGGGSWGTALVSVLQYNGHLVHWWIRRESQARFIEKYGLNPDYLSSTRLDPSLLQVSTSLKDVVESSQLLLLAIPSAYLNQAFQGLSPHILKDKMVISAVKGIEPESLQMVHRWLQQFYGLQVQDTLVIGGPCHSEEVVMQRLSYLTLGMNSIQRLGWIADYLKTPFLNVACSEDVEGISMAAVLKNVYGILSGISQGLRYGDNFSAVLISNAVHEMKQILTHMSGFQRNVNTSVYAGDLLVTAYSGFSRNWIFGNYIGKGYSVMAALMELKMVAEGYHAVLTLSRLEGLEIREYPLLHTVYQILYEKVPADESMQKLVAHLH